MHVYQYYAWLGALVNQYRKVLMLCSYIGEYIFGLAAILVCHHEGKVG